MAIVRYLLWFFLCQSMFVKCVHDREQNVIYEITQKLCKLGELRPKRCMDEAENMVSIRLPKMPKQKRFLVLAVSFQAVSELFMNNTTSTKWVPEELQKLQHLLGERSEFYRKNASAASSANDEDVQQWRTFWSRLNTYLVEKDFSACAWESARSMILSVMSTFYRSRGRVPRQPTCF